MISSLGSHLKAELCHLHQAGPAPLPFQGSHLEEPEGGQPAGPALFILTAEDVQPLVAISKLVGLGRGSRLSYMTLCSVAIGQGRAQGLSKSSGIGRRGWVPQCGHSEPTGRTLKLRQLSPSPQSPAQAVALTLTQKPKSVGIPYSLRPWVTTYALDSFTSATYCRCLGS